MSEPTDQIMPTPGPADTRPRTATIPKAQTADPEAPYGWITDPKTGETRPKKRPGKQSRAQSPPPNRPSNQARQRPAPAAAKGKDYQQPLMDSVEGLWMILAAIPTPENPVKVAGIDVQALSIRAKAQAAVLEDNAGKLVHAVNMVAQHNKQVQHGVERWTADTGPAWILPAMMAVLPFAVQSAQVWRVPVAGDLTDMAKRTDAKFEELVKAMQSPGPVSQDIDTLAGLAEERANLNGDSSA